MIDLAQRSEPYKIALPYGLSMTVFAGAVDATFTAFGIDAAYTPAGGIRSACG